MPDKLNVLLVDDDWAARDALDGFLTKRNMQVSQADCRAAVEAIEDPTIFDVAVLDIVLPDQQGDRAQFEEHVGIELARYLCRHNKRIGIVFLSAYLDRGPEVVQLFMDGHDRIVYLLKGSKPKELLDAIQRVTRDDAGLEIAAGVNTHQATLSEVSLSALTPAERNVLLQALERLPLLTQPEWRVLEAMGACMTRQSAAHHLGIVAKTVDYHLGSIYEKLLLREGNLNQTALMAKLYFLYSLQQITDNRQSNPD